MQRTGFNELIEDIEEAIKRENVKSGDRAKMNVIKEKIVEKHSKSYYGKDKKEE